MEKKCTKIYKILQNTVNSRLVDTPLLRTLAITDTEIQIPGKGYRGFTGNDSRYYGITDTFLVQSGGVKT